MMYRLFVIMLFCVSNGLAQPSKSVAWQEKLSSFYKEKQPVKLHLFFNQPVYAPGDTAYFRAAFITSENHAPLGGKQIITMDIVNNDGVILIRQEFRMHDGWSGNQLVIPTDFSPGVYRVIAYNDWMNNFEHPPYYYGFLKVDGPIEMVYDPDGDSLRYFVEGGNLVADLKSKVVIRSRQNDSLTVIDSQKNIITKLMTDELGLAFFFFTPSAEESYQIKSSTQSIKLNPVAEGFSVLFTPSVSSKSKHRLVIQRKNKAGTNQDLTMMIRHRDQIYYSAELKFRREFVAMNINPEVLPEGLCYLSVNTSDGETVASRYFYNSASSNVMPDIQLQKDVFGTREPVEVNFSLLDQNNAPLLAWVSVSISSIDLFNNQTDDNQMDISRYLSIQSDLCDQYPDWQLNRVKDHSQLDMILISKQQARYPWNEILESGKILTNNLRDYPVIAGQLIDRETGEPLKQSASITFYFGGVGETYTSFADEDGVFKSYLLFDFYDSEKVFYSIEKDNQKLVNAAIKIADDRATYQSLRSKFKPGDSSQYYQYYNQTAEVLNSYKFFYDQTNLPNQVVDNPNAIAEKLVYGADVQVDLDDYLLFPTMKETITEIIPFLKNIKIDGKETVYVYRPDNPLAVNHPPLFMIDGIMTEDYNYFLNLNPANVDKIKLVQSSNKLKRLGELGKHGFVIVETKMLREETMDLYDKQYVTINGLKKEIRFQNSVRQWQLSNLRSPQFKSTLYWNANEKLDKNGKVRFMFNTSDNVGKYVIKIEGLTTTGIPFVSEKTFEVKYLK